MNSSRPIILPIARGALLGTAVVLLALACRPRSETDGAAATMATARGTGSGASSGSGAGAGSAKKTITGSGSGPGSASATTAGSGSGSAEPKTTVSTLTGFDVHLRVKNLPQLRSAIEACVGPDLTVVTADMILPVNGTVPPVDAASGRFAFLNAARYAAGADVLDVEGAFLLDPNHGERFGADADQISAPYLRALETVANVVAHNCSLANSHCDCSADDKAKDLVTRCLPAFDPTTATFQAAAGAFRDSCRGGEGALKTAVASLIASYAFAAKN